MKVFLTVLVPGPMEGKTIPITVPRFVIGRDPGCHIQPNSPAISKLHCALEIAGDKVSVRDLGSVAGTFVNDRKIAGCVQLNHGDLLKVGPLLFALVIEAPQKPSPQVPATAGKNEPKRAGDTAEMPAAELFAAEILAQTPDAQTPATEAPTASSDTAVVNTKTSDTACENQPQTGVAGGKAPRAEADAPSTSLAAKDILKKYLCRKRAKE